MSKIREKAEYHFKENVPSRCAFYGIYRIKRVNGHYICYGLFKCKKRMMYKKLIMDLKGTLLNYE